MVTPSGDFFQRSRSWDCCSGMHRLMHAQACMELPVTGYDRLHEQLGRRCLDKQLATSLLSVWLRVRIPPMTRGIFCDSAHIRPVVATPETPMTGATPNPPGISSGPQKEAPPRMSRRGCRTILRSESFPSCQGCSLCMGPAPDSGCRRVCVCPMASGCGLPPR